MPTVIFTPNLQRHVECPTVAASGATVAEVLEDVFARNPRARGYVLDEHGRLRRHIVVFIGEQRIADRDGLTDRVAPDANLYVMQALSGGL